MSKVLFSIPVNVVCYIILIWCRIIKCCVYLTFYENLYKSYSFPTLISWKSIFVDYCLALIATDDLCYFNIPLKPKFSYGNYMFTIVLTATC